MSVFAGYAGRETRGFHCPANPFGEPVNENELEEGEIPMIHCSQCFSNREETVLDFMMDDHGDIDIFQHERIHELYEEFFNDKSGRDNSQIYARYPKYTFEEFQTHMEEVFQSEMNTTIDFTEYLEELYGEEGEGPEPVGPAQPHINLDEIEEFIDIVERNDIPELQEPLNENENEAHIERHDDGGDSPIDNQNILNNRNQDNRNFIGIERQIIQYIDINLYGDREQHNNLEQNGQYSPDRNIRNIYLSNAFNKTKNEKIKNKKTL